MLALFHSVFIYRAASPQIKESGFSFSYSWKLFLQVRHRVTNMSNGFWHLKGKQLWGTQHELTSECQMRGQDQGSLMPTLTELLGFLWEFWQVEVSLDTAVGLCLNFYELKCLSNGKTEKKRSWILQVIPSEMRKKYHDFLVCFRPQ